MMIMAEKGRSKGAGNFGKAVDYARGQDKDHEGQKVEYETTRNVYNIDTAAPEMKACASENHHLKNEAVYRYLVTWKEGEHPTPKQVEDCLDHSMKALGMEDHQAIACLHCNTDNYHLHVVVNRVHPETSKAACMTQDMPRLEYAARELELKHGWEHGEGFRYEINEAGKIVEKELDPNRERPLNTPARDFEAWTGEQSFKTWIKEQPAQDVKATIEKGGNWQDVHRSLAKHGLEIQDQGKGFVIVDRENPDKCHAKASDMARFASKGNLEAKLGPYEPPAVITQIEAPERTYKRDPDKRIDRREERKEEREKFYQQYKAHRQAQDKTRGTKNKEITAERKAALEQIKEQSKTDREAIKKQPIPGREKQALYTAVRLRTAQQKEALDKQMEAKRQAIKEQYPGRALSYKDYAHQEANKGNDVAVSVLRGLAYREQREAKIDKDREGATTEDGRETPPLMKTHPQPEKPNTTLENLDFRVSRHGNVSFYDRETGTEVFRDTGRQLLFTGIKKETPEAVEAGLRLAREKFGNNIELTGSEEFKKLATREAVKLGITITNKDMQPYQQQLRQERQQERQKQIQQTRGKDKGMER